MCRNRKGSLLIKCFKLHALSTGIRRADMKPEYFTGQALPEAVNCMFHFKTYIIKFMS